MTLDALSRGFLDGSKVGNAFGRYHHQVGILKLASNTFGTYKLYNQAHTLGLFEKYPGLIKPIKWGLIAMTGINLITVLTTSIFSMERNVRKGPERYQTKNPVWNLTPKVIAIGTIASNVLDYKKQPERAITFGASSAFMLAMKFTDRAKSLPWFIPWTPRGYIFITGDWSDRGGIAFKAASIFIKTLWNSRH